MFESGISDHYLNWNQRSRNTKLKPKVLWKRQYKNFSKKYLLQLLKNVLSNKSIFSLVNNKFKETLDHHEPIKITKPSGNTKPIINKTLRKKITKRSWLKNKARKTGLIEDLKLYKI